REAAHPPHAAEPRGWHHREGDADPREQRDAVGRRGRRAHARASSDERGRQEAARLREEREGPRVAHLEVFGSAPLSGGTSRSTPGETLFLTEQGAKRNEPGLVAR